MVRLNLLSPLLLLLTPLTSARPVDPLVESSPPPPTSLIPRKIWYKLGRLGLNDYTRYWTGTCISQNPHYEHEFMTDETGDEFVKDHFSHNHELVNTFLSLNIPILKADILRYLLLYVGGGIWSDLDASCTGVPMDEWIPKEYRDKARLVVGMEFDMVVGDEGWGDYERQFETWAIMAAPGSQHLLVVVDYILDQIKRVCREKDVTPDQLKMNMIDVIQLTGPMAFAQGVWKSLNQTVKGGVDRRKYFKLLEPALIEDVLIMPAASFTRSMNQKYTEEQLGKMGPSLIEHHYSGTWKNNKGGE